MYVGASVSPTFSGESRRTTRRVMNLAAIIVVVAAVVIVVGRVRRQTPVAIVGYALLALALLLVLVRPR
jgi:hypothetical protein